MKLHDFYCDKFRTFRDQSGDLVPGFRMAQDAIYFDSITLSCIKVLSIARVLEHSEHGRNTAVTARGKPVASSEF